MTKLPWAMRRGHGRDEELDLHANAALEACEVTVQEYCDLAPDGDEVSSFKDVQGINIKRVRNFANLILGCYSLDRVKRHNHGSMNHGASKSFRRTKCNRPLLDLSFVLARKTHASKGDRGHVIYCDVKPVSPS